MERDDVSRGRHKATQQNSGSENRTTNITIPLLYGTQIYMYVREMKTEGGLFGGKKGTSESKQWG